jgi:hypothetical protein
VDLDVLMAAWGTTTAENYFFMRKNSATVFNAGIRSAGSGRTTTIGSFNLGAFFMHGWGTQGASTKITRNDTAGSSVAFVPDGTASSTVVLGILHSPSNAPFNGSMASAIFFKDNELSTSQQLSVYTLYKSTLGKGLNLP